jgi:formylglycine-generating enzyme required for sulfatase activity
MATKRARTGGLYDMVGNVWQWTADWHGETYYQTSERQDPSSPPSGTMRALRGGSWVSFPSRVLVSFRLRFVPRNPLVGFWRRRAGNDFPLFLSTNPKE